jgi:hypothetical protein
MRRVLLASAVVVIAYPMTGRAQSIKLSDVAGTWESTTMVGPNDSVVSHSVTMATAGKKGWTLTFPGRDPIPLRVVAVGGDSVVTEAGPFPSVLRPGQTVTLLHSVNHYSGNTAHGTFVSHYASGTTLQGKTTATRKQ